MVQTTHWFVARVAAHVGLKWSLNVVPDQVTFLNFQNLISLRNWFLLVVKASLVRRRACGSTRRYLTKHDVIGEITGPTVRWLSGIKEKNLNGCGKLTLASDLSDIADMAHVDLSNMSSLTGTSLRVAAHVGLQWSLNVLPDQVTFLNFQNLTSFWS